jgi:gliding motility-associated-like protein
VKYPYLYVNVLTSKSHAGLISCFKLGIVLFLYWLTNTSGRLPNIFIVRPGVDAVGLAFTTTAAGAVEHSRLPRLKNHLVPFSSPVFRNIGVVVPPSINISVPSAVICSGTSVTLTATATDAGNSPVYQWKVNGTPAGTNATSYTSSALSNNDVITCELTSDAAGTPATVTSNSIKMTVNPSPVVSISGDSCVGGILTFQSNVPAATLVWTLNNSTSVSTQTAGMNPNAVTIAGGNGAGFGTNQLDNPNRICMDASGNLYIPDMGNVRVQKWAPGATSGTTVAGGFGTGSAANQFNRPTSVAVDSKGNLFVTDQSNGRIQKWAPGVSNGGTFASGLSTPTGIAIDANDNIYVSQQDAARVTRYPAGSSIGVTVAGGQGYGSSASQLSTPTGIFVDASGNVYICDTDNDRVQKWAPGANTGTTVAGGHGSGSSSNQLANPLGIFVDRYGNIFISDYNNARIQKWTPGATSGITVAGGNGTGTGSNQLNRPAGVWVDADNNLYVADFFNARVQKFSNTLTSTYTTLAPGNYTATVTTAAGCTATTNSITVVAAHKPLVSITAYPGGICTGVPVTFTAASTYGGTNTLYQWKVNGANAVGNGNSFVSTSLKIGDAVSCVATSNADLCLTSKTATSNVITMNKAGDEVAAVSITASDTSICAGGRVLFTAKPLAGGTSPVFEWKINNNPVADNNQATFATDALKNDDVISCSMVSNANLCPSNLTASSNLIIIHTLPLNVSTINISASDTFICTGTPVTFKATGTNEGLSPIYDWKINGQNTGTNSRMYVSNLLRDGDIVSCSLTSNFSCLQQPTVSSNAVKIKVDQLPVIKTRPDTAITPGTSVRLNTSVVNRVDTFRWTPSTTLDDYTISNPLATPNGTTTYRLIATTAGGCKATAEVTISIFTKVMVPNAFSPNGDGLNDTWGIPGLGAYNDCEVTVYNRYGQQVFQSTGYTKRWDGTINGKPLPSGSYYYIINLKGPKETMKGFVVIIR